MSATPEAFRKARKLRREMSLPEVLLWKVLRQHPSGLKFRRQHPLGSYVADFYAPSAKLIIEIDGIAHDMGDAPDHDARRDAWMKAQGYRVVRVPAKDVLKNVNAAAQSIVDACRG